MKSYFRNYAKEGELSYQVAKRFAKESTKEDLAKKIIEIIEGNNTDWETINMIAYLCKNVKGGIRMTDEEMAEQYLKDESKCLIEDNEGNIINITKKVKEAYLAGLKAGRPKWHKVADGDLPKPNIAVLVCLQFEKWTTTYIAYYRPAIKKWQMYNMHEAQRQPIEADYIDADEVIAWCEIPKYTEE